MNKHSVIARLTMSHQDGSQTVVEIHTDASHDNFFRWYKRQPEKRNKTFVRTSQRSRSIKDDASLEALAQTLIKHFEGMAKVIPTTRSAPRFDGRLVTGHKIIIIKKKLYRRFLECSVEKLPGYRPVRQVSVSPWIPGRRSSVGPRIGHRSPQQKMNRLMGKA